MDVSTDRTPYSIVMMNYTNLLSVILRRAILLIYVITIIFHSINNEYQRKRSVHLLIHAHV